MTDAITAAAGYYALIGLFAAILAGRVLPELYWWDRIGEDERNAAVFSAGAFWPGTLAVLALYLAGAATVLAGCYLASVARGWRQLARSLPRARLLGKGGVGS